MDWPNKWARFRLDERTNACCYELGTEVHLDCYEQLRECICACEWDEWQRDLGVQDGSRPEDLVENWTGNDWIVRLITAGLVIMETANDRNSSAKAPLIAEQPRTCLNKL